MTRSRGIWILFSIFFLGFRCFGLHWLERIPWGGFTKQSIMIKLHDLQWMVYIFVSQMKFLSTSSRCSWRKYIFLFRQPITDKYLKSERFVGMCDGWWWWWWWSILYYREFVYGEQRFEVGWVFGNSFDRILFLSRLQIQYTMDGWWWWWWVLVQKK